MDGFRLRADCAARHGLACHSFQDVPVPDLTNDQAKEKGDETFAIPSVKPGIPLITVALLLSSVALAAKVRDTSRWVLGGAGEYGLLQAAPWTETGPVGRRTRDRSQQAAPASWGRPSPKTTS